MFLRLSVHFVEHIAGGELCPEFFKLLCREVLPGNRLDLILDARHTLQLVQRRRRPPARLLRGYPTSYEGPLLYRKPIRARLEIALIDHVLLDIRVGI